MPDRRVDPAPERVGQLGALWWLPVGLGVLSIIVGAVVLAKPDDSLKTFAVIAGIFILLDGIVELATGAGRGTANRGLVVLLGVLNLIVGILLIRHPIGGVQAIALFLGIWLMAAGVVRFVITFEESRQAARSLRDRCDRSTVRARDRRKPPHRVRHASTAGRNLVYRVRDRDDRFRRPRAHRHA